MSSARAVSSASCALTRLILVTALATPIISLLGIALAFWELFRIGGH